LAIGFLLKQSAPGRGAAAASASEPLEQRRGDLALLGRRGRTSLRLSRSFVCFLRRRHPNAIPEPCRTPTGGKAGLGTFAAAAWV